MIPKTILNLGSGNYAVLQQIDYENAFYVFYRSDANGTLLNGETLGRGVSCAPNAPTEAGAVAAVKAALGL